MKKMKGLVVLSLVVLLMSLLQLPVFASGHNAMVRVLHASPDAPAVDVYVNGEVAVENASFKDITGYLELEAGSYQIAIHAAGSDEAVYEQEVAVEAGTHYTVAAVGLLEDGFRLEAFADDLTVDEGKSNIRVGHLSPGSPAVDVGLIGGDSLVEGAEFFAVTDYLTLDPGTYDLEIRAAGTTDQVLDLSGTTLEANKIYSAYAVGADPSSLDIVLVVDDAAQAPEAMPQTGFETTTSMMMPLLVGLLSVGALGLFITKRRAIKR